MNIRTNNQWRKFRYQYEVPSDILESEFDWLDRPDDHDGFISYQNMWFHLQDFERIVDSPLAEQWDGIKHLTYDSGILIKIRSDGNAYKIARFW